MKLLEWYLQKRIANLLYKSHLHQDFVIFLSKQRASAQTNYRASASATNEQHWVIITVAALYSDVVQSNVSWHDHDLKFKLEVGCVSTNFWQIAWRDWNEKENSNIIILIRCNGSGSVVWLSHLTQDACILKVYLVREHSYICFGEIPLKELGEKWWLMSFSDNIYGSLKRNSFIQNIFL